MTTKDAKELSKAKNAYLKADKALQKRILELNDVIAEYGSKMQQRLPKLETMPKTVATYKSLTTQIKDLLQQPENEPKVLKAKVVELAAKIAQTPTMTNKRGVLQANLTALTEKQRIKYNRCWHIVTRNEEPLYQAIIKHFANYDFNLVQAEAIDLLSSGDYHESDLTKLFMKMNQRLTSKKG